MARSKNKEEVIEDVVISEESKEEKSEKKEKVSGEVFPKWKYHDELPEGKIFHSEEEFKDAEKKLKGWVNSYADVKSYK